MFAVVSGSVCSQPSTSLYMGSKEWGLDLRLWHWSSTLLAPRIRQMIPGATVLQVIGTAGGGKCKNLGLRALGAWGIICEELDAGMCGFCAAIGSREWVSNTSNRIGRIAPTQLMTDSFRWPTSRRRRVFLPRRHGREAVLLCRVPIAMCRGRRKPKRGVT